MLLYRHPFAPSVFALLARRLVAVASRSSRRLESWLPTGAPPRNLIEQIVSALGALVADRGPFAGAEWWVRAADENEGKGLHFDKDEQLFAARGTFVHPVLASVFYVTATGGDTIVLDQGITPRRHRLTPEWPRAGMLITPKENHYLVFPGHLRHGVTASRRREASVRVTLLVNWWREVPRGQRRRRIAVATIPMLSTAGHPRCVSSVGTSLDRRTLRALA